MQYFLHNSYLMLSVNMLCIILPKLSSKVFDDWEEQGIVTLTPALTEGPFALVFISGLFTVTSNFTMK